MYPESQRIIVFDTLLICLFCTVPVESVSACISVSPKAATNVFGVVLSINIFSFVALWSTVLYSVHVLLPMC